MSKTKDIERSTVQAQVHIVGTVSSRAFVDTKATVNEAVQVSGPIKLSCLLLYMCVKSSVFLGLKGKFSSGIEGALASTLHHDFNWKQLSEMMLCIVILMFSKFICVILI